LFLNSESYTGTWQAAERQVARFLLHDGFSDVRMVGQTRDKGADVVAQKNGKRWLIQVKHWKNKIGPDVVDETLRALKFYRAQIPVIVSTKGFYEPVYVQQQRLMAQGVPLQLWSGRKLLDKASKLDDDYPLGDPSDIFEKREYQEKCIDLLRSDYLKPDSHGALIVMATGLGKTRVVFEFLRRTALQNPVRVLVLAHSNALVYQLEKSIWPYLKANSETIVWNGYEEQSTESLSRVPYVFACLNTVASFVERELELPEFDIIFVDECHHVSDDGMYNQVLDSFLAGRIGGPFLIGVTATPWRPDDSTLENTFGDPLVTIDLIRGLKEGFLSKIDYRMFTDNIDWEGLQSLKDGVNYSPKRINRTLFISQWDDAVVYELKDAWQEQPNPRAIVFCGTIDHAITMRDRINALGFCRAEAIYSAPVNGKAQEPHERNRILCDFADGEVQVVCAIDIFNEGLDVPDVNIVVFQRVTHSRRIFIQQLGRGLRLKADTDKVIVLDFVSDIRRFAAGINLKDSLEDRKPVRVRLRNKVTFRQAGGDDPSAESFLRQWLEDVTAIEEANEDASVLSFPPGLLDMKS
jgi:superfamily II DNA or RNA helicase